MSIDTHPAAIPASHEVTKAAQSARAERLRQITYDEARWLGDAAVYWFQNGDVDRAHEYSMLHELAIQPPRDRLADS